MSDGKNIESAIRRLYKLRKKIGKKSEFVETDLLEEQRKDILDFDRYLTATGKGKARRCHVMDRMRHWARLLPKKPFREMTRADLEIGIAKLEESDFKETTVESFKAILRQFYRWLEGGDEGILPKKISWCRIDPKKFSIRANHRELLEPHEVDWLVECADTLMVKLLIKMTYEASLRIHEAIGEEGLSMGMVEEDEYGLKIQVGEKTKTGSRCVRICDSLSLFKEYTKTEHPSPHDTTAPLFGVFYGGKWKPLSYNYARYKINSVAKKAKNLHPSIRHKKCHLHSLRKARLTLLAPELPEMVLKKHAGWSESSKMARIYCDLSPKRYDDAILSKVYNIEVQNNGIPRQVKKCPSCKEINDSSFTLCEKCNRVLSSGDGIKIDMTLDEMRNEINFIKQNLLTNDKLAEKLREIIRDEVTEKVKEKIKKHDVVSDSGQI